MESLKGTGYSKIVEEMVNQKNIFLGAKFGDKFKTKGNSEAIYVELIQRASTYHRLIINSSTGIADVVCTDDGTVQHSPESNNIIAKILLSEVTTGW